jgi:ribosomal protein S18 acetylase RimI-like enzyme
VKNLEAAEVPAPFSLRAPTTHDLPAVARLFVEAFSAHPVSSLSTRLQHKFIAAHAEEHVALVAAEPLTSRVIGFAIGGRYEQLDRARRAFIYGNVIPLALHRLSRRDSGLRLPGRAPRSDRASPSAGYELRYLAVVAAERGCGIGSALLRELESDMLSDQPYYVWVLAERIAAMKFYLGHGFREEHRINGHVRMVKGR